MKRTKPRKQAKPHDEQEAKRLAQEAVKAELDRVLHNMTKSRNKAVREWAAGLLRGDERGG